jgi:hypothetical protein
MTEADRRALRAAFVAFNPRARFARRRREPAGGTSPRACGVAFDRI